MARPRRTRITEQEQEFCCGVASHGNETKAARDAGYSWPNHIAWKLMGKPHVRAEVERLRALVAARIDATTVATGLEVREKFTWLMRHAENEETQLKAGMVLAKLLGMGDAFNHPGSVALPQVIDASGLAQKSTAELVERGKVIALRLLKSGND